MTKIMRRKVVNPDSPGISGEGTHGTRGSEKSLDNISQSRDSPFGVHFT